MFEIDQYQPIEITLNIKCENIAKLHNIFQENDIPCICEVVEPLEPKLYKVRLTIAPHKFQEFTEKINEVFRDRVAKQKT